MIDMPESQPLPLGLIAWLFDTSEGLIAVVNMTWVERMALEKADYPVFMPDAFSRERTLVDWEAL